MKKSFVVTMKCDNIAHAISVYKTTYEYIFWNDAVTSIYQAEKIHSPITGLIIKLYVEERDILDEEYISSRINKAMNTPCSSIVSFKKIKD